MTRFSKLFQYCLTSICLSEPNYTAQGRDLFLVSNTILTRNITTLARLSSSLTPTWRADHPDPAATARGLQVRRILMNSFVNSDHFRYQSKHLDPCKPLPDSTRRTVLASSKLSTTPQCAVSSGCSRRDRNI